MRYTTISIVSIIFLVLLISIVDEKNAEAIFSPVAPSYKVQKLPTIQDFESKSQAELLGDFTPNTVLRDNGEKIQTYIFATSGATKQFIMIFYFEDKTDERLEYYVPFNSDYFVMGFQSSVTENPQFIYAERKGRGCMIPYDMYDQFWDGSFSGCEGGTAEVKQTENGWAIYVKFFGVMDPPTTEKPFLGYFDYGDIQKSENKELKEFSLFSWPDVFTYGKVIPVTDSEPVTLKVNSGTISSNDFLYKPSKFLTTNLEKNSFNCADNTITISNKKFTYETKDDPIRIDVKIKSDVIDGDVFLDVFNANGDIVYHSSQKTSNGEGTFLFTLDTGKGVYTAEAEFGIDGPKDKISFVIGDPKIVETEEDECYFYLLYNESSKKLSVIVHVDDASHHSYDQIQIFVDRNGDSTTGLNSDDISFAIDNANFGNHQFSNSQGWITKDPKKVDGTLINNPDSYEIFIPVTQVSKNFRFSLEQIDHTGIEIKSARIPENGFSVLPEHWSQVEFVSNSLKKWSADSSRPNEIVAKQSMDINLILVGAEWDSDLQNKIKQKLTTSYKPIIWSELSRAGMEYKYNYNFISTDDETNNAVFDFMNSAADPVRPFYGENDFDEPWGFGPWIQKNHTDWINAYGYNVEYRLIDAEAMEDFLNENVIQGNFKLTKPNAANLIFIADDMENIEFLHNYKIFKPDSLHKNPHQAVGLMGYGGNYNFYFFDLYAVPWEEFFGIDFMYDKSLDNYATSLLDVTTDERYVTLISDCVNNATSLLITPAYVYDPVYKENYVLDLVLVADPKVGTGTVQVLSEHFINTDKIESELRELTPYSNWQINLQADNIKSTNIPKSLKNAIGSKTTYQPIEGLNYYTTDILSTEKLKKAVAEWAGARQTSKFKDFKDISESEWIIPTIVVVSDAYNEVYLQDEYGFLASGIAPSHPADSRQPCCAFGVTTDDRVWNKKVSVTDLVLHEVGHVMGFMHPFLGYDKNDEVFQNEYFAKWYGSVMAYNSPSQYGCGVWYGIYFEGICGISDTFFTKFEKDNHARGVTAYLIEAAESNVYRTLLELENSGQDLPDISKQRIGNVESKLSQAKSAFASNKIFDDDGAYKLALDAASESAILAKTSGIVYDVEAEQVKISIPEWIKNTITWWSEGSISEQEFVGALQYLIKERIIVLPDIPESSQTATGRAVPEWVRNNAIWWSQDRISDNDFVSGLQYLIKEGIIRVS